jgi:hypothetical protein
MYFLLFVGLRPGLHFHSENKGSTFLGNVGEVLYIAAHYRIQYFSCCRINFIPECTILNALNLPFTDTDANIAGNI